VEEGKEEVENIEKETVDLVVVEMVVV